MRPVQPGDADAVVALHSRLSGRTRYLRYFWPCPRLAPSDVDRLVSVDHCEREAVVVEMNHRLVAVGQYERLADNGADAEVAMVVEDAYQRRGLGSALLGYLAAAARRQGVRRFVAEVLPDNAGVARALSGAGYRVQRHERSGSLHLTFPI